jgi:hypothetical protein
MKKPRQADGFFQKYRGTIAELNGHIFPSSKATSDSIAGYGSCAMSIPDA